MELSLKIGYRLWLGNNFWRRSSILCTSSEPGARKDKKGDPSLPDQEEKAQLLLLLLLLLGWDRMGEEI
jgi:hypothetical protein